MADAARGERLLYGGFAITSITAAGGQATLAIDSATVYVGWIKAGIEIRISGASNSANNGTFVVVSASSTSIVITNASAVTEGTGAVIWYEVAGSSTRHHLDKAFLPQREYTRQVVEFEFVIADTSGQMDDAAYAAEEQAALEVFRTPRRDFLITVGSTTVLSLKHSDNTAFDCEPVITPVPGPANTVRSSRFRVTLTFDLPADNVATSGNRFVNVSLSYTPSRRRMFTIEGMYTAVPGGTTARAQYAANIGALATSVASVLGITYYELVAEGPTVHNSTNKTLTFSRTYREIIFSQAGSSLDDSSIVEQHLRIRRRLVGPGDTPSANRLVTYSVTYDASIDKTVSQALTSKWESIKSWILGQVAAISGGQSALMSVEPDFDYDENRISATMEIVAAENGSMIEQRITTAMHNVSGAVLTPVWGDHPLMKFLFQGPAQKVQTITARRLYLGGAVSGAGGGSGGGGPAIGMPLLIPGGLGVGFGGTPGVNSIIGNINGLEILGLLGSGGKGGGGGGGGGGGNQESSVVMVVDDETTPIRYGVDGVQMDCTEQTTVTVREFFVPPPYGGAPTGTPTIGASG